MHYEDTSRVDKFSEVFLGEGLRYEISDFLTRLNHGEKDDFKLTRGETVALAGIMEEFMKASRE